MGSTGKAVFTHNISYEPRQRGQITRYEAGILYKAVKNGNVITKPELITELYNATESYIGHAQQRYAQNYIYYDRIENMTRALLNSDYSTAQKIINDIQDDAIKHAGKKSIWYKYQQGV